MISAQQKTSVLPDDFREPDVNEKLAAEHGLKADEYNLILDLLGRLPSFTELGIFSVMWSEHCSYKSSRMHLKKLPTEAPWVIQGPGENAGVIDIGDGQAAVFKMESHNHPSFIEPYQGAATGVGGILRDIFTMGARPVANLNALRFGAPDHPKTPHLVSGVVAGIGGYGNCIGVPTVGGEVTFHESYNSNILVNAMTVGLADTDRIFYARGASTDQPVVYVGAKTGRDGIHGATMASASFDNEADQKRPTVQVGDPFTEKLLLEACLELMQEDAIISIQDMGAAGLTSSSVEIASKGEIGVHLDLDKVPQRENLMTPYEIMLSESQERMLMILKPGREEEARKIFEKWDLDFAVIGQTTARQNLVLDMYGQTWCDIPVPPLVDAAPVYDRPAGKPPLPDEMPGTLPDETRNLTHIANALEVLVSSPDLCSRRWVWEQYDSLVGGQTCISPGIRDTQSGKQADAALVKIPGNQKALAITSDCIPRYCYADPFEGGKQAVCESFRNICATGAKPMAVTNNLNFGNPERPEIMAQFIGCIDGMAEACNDLEYPVVSGNVSLYNETNETGIQPTPTIGGVGVISDWKNSLPLGFHENDENIFVIGKTRGHLGQSLYLKYLHGLEAGPPPPVSPKLEKQTGEFIRFLADQKFVTACHDISDGGLLPALAEMAMAGNIGAEIEIRDEIRDEIHTPAFWFGEDQARYIVTAKDADLIHDHAKSSGIPIQYIGKTGGRSLNIGTDIHIDLEKLINLHESWFPDKFDEVGD